MMFISGIVRFLFWVFVVTWIFRLVARVLGGMLKRAVAPPPQNAEAVESSEASHRRLVRDPVCGVHVAEVLSIPMRDGGRTLHFCSTVCRDKYAGNVPGYAANG